MTNNSVRTRVPATLLYGVSRGAVKLRRHLGARREALHIQPSARVILVLTVATVAGAALCGDTRGVLEGIRRANTCGDSAAVSWEPAVPRDGALFRVRVN